MAEQEPPNPGTENPAWVSAGARWRQDRARYKDEVLRPAHPKAFEIPEELYTKAAFNNDDLTDAEVLLSTLHRPSFRADQGLARRTSQPR